MVPLPPTRLSRLVPILLLAAAACDTRTTVQPATTSTSTSTTTTSSTTTTTSTTASSTTTPPPATTTIATGPARVVSRGDTNRRAVALTFDAGADAGFTAQILDVLTQSTVRGTFGVTGRWAEAHPDLVKRMAQAGHLVMNHSYEHRSFTGVSARPAVLSTADRINDLQRADDAIRTSTGQSTRPWFRSPYGDYDASLLAVLGSSGYRYNVLWTVDSLGWQGLSAAAIASRCVERAVPGAILLFHVGAQSQDAAALPSIIAGLRQAGYAFATVAEIVGG
jgi:peptidoglycan/xylan/chitin deacetylase (PgdA/CDA1 family)